MVSSLLYLVFSFRSSTMDFNKTWFAYISAEIIRQCIDMCTKECRACKDGILSPLLHYHNELNLREKMVRYVDRVELDLTTLFDLFIIQFGWFGLDRDQFLANAQAFIDFSTPDAMFYGKYINYENDFAIYADTGENPLIEKAVSPVEEKPIKAKRHKKNVTSQNDIPGTSATSS